MPRRAHLTVAAGLAVATLTSSYSYAATGEESGTARSESASPQILVDGVDHPLPTWRNTWMSEWSPNGSTWNENWDDGSGYDGFAVASSIHESLATAGVSGYVYWFGTSQGATRGLIQLDGDAYHVSKRLWALAAYSRFIRPGAVRVGARATGDGLKVTAFRDADGGQVVEILNTGTAAVTTDLLTGGDARRSRVTAYLTDSTRSVSPVDAVHGRGANMRADLAPRSLTTIVSGGPAEAR